MLGTQRLSAVALVAITLLVSPSEASAQPPAFEQGEASFSEGSFQEAADAYRLAVAEDPDHGMSWFRLGMALHELGVWGGAASAYERAIELGTQSVSARWRLARVRAQAGDSEAAFQALEELASSGFGSVATLSSEAELAGLRDDGRWSDVLQRVQANSEPCMHQEVSRRFDFWIGEWEVFSPQGAPLGENRVESVLVGCALVENWTNTAGRSGKSLNVYDPSLGDPAWRQLYVGDFGGVTDYRDGRWEDGVMHFQARVLGAQGDTLTRHMRFRPVGKDTVQQIIEDEDATGQTTLQFHGVYVRKRAP